MLSFFFQYFSHLSREYCLSIISLDKLVTTLSDQPQAILLRRRPSSLNTLSNQDVIVGAMPASITSCSKLTSLRAYPPIFKLLRRGEYRAPQLQHSATRNGISNVPQTVENLQALERYARFRIVRPGQNRPSGSPLLRCRPSPFLALLR